MSSPQTANGKPQTAPPVFGALIAICGLLFALWLILRPIFDGAVILNPIAFHLGPIQIRWYGLILAAAIGGAYEWSRRRLIARQIDSAAAETIVWWGSVLGIIGARLGFVAQNPGFYLDHPLQMFAVTQGGLSIHGAVLGGAFGVWLAARRFKLHFLLLADVTAPTVLAGTILGRLGNFMNYELYGYPTTVAWKMFVPLANRVPGYESFAFFHPTFLYEALLNLVMLGIILRIEQIANSKRQMPALGNSHSRFTIHDLPTGSIFFLCVALYSVSRFIVEFFRIGTEVGAGLTLAQWVSLGLIFASIGFLVVRSRRLTDRH